MHRREGPSQPRLVAHGANNASAFEQSLKERGIHLAAGDRRSFVVVDFQGEVHSLPRALGLKTKDVAARLATADLKPVENVRADAQYLILPPLPEHDVYMPPVMPTVEPVKPFRFASWDDEERSR